MICLLIMSSLLVATNGQLLDKVVHSTIVDFLVGGVKSLVKCLNMAETSDKWLGKLELKKELYCSLDNFRFIPGFLCCTPQNTTDFDLNFYLFKPDQDDYEKIDFHDSKVKDKLADSNEDVVFIASGLFETMKNSPWLNHTKDGFLARGHPVILVDWGSAAKISYWQAIATMRTVGAAIGYAIVEWDIIDKVLVSGLSLGGQVIGEVGKYVREKTGRLVKECHALDPAGPFFDGGHKDVILDKGDCKVVQVVHTSALSSNPIISIPGTLFLRLGSALKSGHCDYWVNCGYFQGLHCLAPDIGPILSGFKSLILELNDGPLIGKLAENVACSHIRAAVLYRNAVTNKCDFESYKCKNCGEGLTSSYCRAEGPVANSFPPNSKCDSSMDINYVMMTTGWGDFCSVKP